MEQKEKGKVDVAYEALVFRRSEDQYSVHQAQGLARSGLFAHRQESVVLRSIGG
jgi:hypothetical protein